MTIGARIRVSGGWDCPKGEEDWHTLNCMDQDDENQPHTFRKGNSARKGRCPSPGTSKSTSTWVMIFRPASSVSLMERGDLCLVNRIQHVESAMEK